MTKSFRGPDRQRRKDGLVPGIAFDNSPAGSPRRALSVQNLGGRARLLGVGRPRALGPPRLSHRVPALPNAPFMVD